jgi:diguanylate cyclase (GGDEF)-like protein
VTKADDKILIISDEVDLLNKINALLAEKNYKVKVAQQGDEGIRLLQQEPFDLVITDLVIPGVSGPDIMSYVRNNCPEILVIIITGNVPLESVIQAIREGAYDFITKPFQSHIVKAVIDRAFERIRLKHQLDEVTNKLQMLAITDELTSLHNVRYFNERLSIEFERARRYNTPLSCIMVDVDYFKEINDEYGHITGDDVLRKIAQIIKQTVRTSDLTARYGGDEFALLLPQTDLEKSRLLAERIKQSVHEYNFSDASREMPNISISLGVCTFPHHNIKQKKDLVKLADEALYAAKQEDRNRVEVRD